VEWGAHLFDFSCCRSNVASKRKSEADLVWLQNNGL
jgi:hypothetical protein